MTDQDQASIQALVEAAADAKERAHCPYSNFRVGAALLTEGGEIFKGCNVENACYPVGICAERTAIVKAVSEGHSKFLAIAISTDKATIAYPCGMCRQNLREFSSDLVLYCADKDKNYKTTFLNVLLPDSFGPEDLALC